MKDKNPKEMTSFERKDEIRRLKEGLEIRKDYPPHHPIIVAFKKRLKVLENVNQKEEQ